MPVAEPSNRCTHQAPTIRGLTPQDHMAPAQTSPAFLPVWATSGWTMIKRHWVNILEW